ncbi:MAG: menaquinone-dependent protoporphyrinogen IX dehydrogenase [Pasteurellales bacterium]|nr:MAG: menaquinone-dependent protoporphyrinogen IX dehydrogenase [Pasteurellales bacterium]
MKTLILYVTADGQTKRIAENIAENIQGEISIFSLQEHKISAQQLNNADQIIIGASIRYGHFKPIVAKFIAQHYEILNQKKSAFFSVNIVARKPGKNTAQTNAYTKKFLQKIKWKPTIAEVFAGRLMYPKYRWYDRLAIQFIMRLTGGETDTTKEFEYTNWKQVKAFAEKFN